MPDVDPSIRERQVTTNGVELRVLEAGDPGSPTVLLAHGFPELAYSWRHQMPALAAAGYHVLAPDQRGYGGSSRPEAIQAYDIFHLTDDLLGLLDDVGVERATFVGHDWGSMVVWNQALLNSDRVEAVVGMSVPFVPRSQRPPIEMMRERWGDRFFYILHFQEPGVAEADLERDPATTMRRLLCGVRGEQMDGESAALMSEPGPAGFVERMPEAVELPDWLSQEELDHYVEVFARTGFAGGVNWYRNFDRNWELTPHLEGATVKAPSLFIGGSLDPVIAMSPPGKRDDHLADHRGNVIVDGAGHWVQQERPTEVNDALLGFLADVYATTEGDAR